MKVVLDTNVLVSALFFGGVPGRILDACRDGKVQIVLAVEAEIVAAPTLSASVSSDPDDDKFLACADASRVGVIVSGDRHLLAHDGWHGLRVLRPRRFADEFLGGG